MKRGREHAEAVAAFATVAPHERPVRDDIREFVEADLPGG